MEQTLTELAPILKEKSEATAELLKIVAVDQAEAEKSTVAVIKEADVAKKTAAGVKIIKDNAQADLDKAPPALQSVVDALNSLNKGNVTEIKSFAKPPPLVQGDDGGGVHPQGCQAGPGLREEAAVKTATFCNCCRRPSTRTTSPSPS